MYILQRIIFYIVGFMAETVESEARPRLVNIWAHYICKRRKSFGKTRGTKQSRRRRLDTGNITLQNLRLWNIRMSSFNRTTSNSQNIPFCRR